MKLDVHNLKPFSSGYLTGKVSDLPKVERGGHVFLSIIKDCQQIKCAIYKPTSLTMIALKLIKGDVIKVGGGYEKQRKFIKEF